MGKRKIFKFIFAIAVLLAVICTSNVFVQAKWKDIKTSTGYTVSRMKIANHNKDYKNGYQKESNSCVFAKSDKLGIVMTDNLYKLEKKEKKIYKSYLSSWDSDGKIKYELLQSKPGINMKCDQKGCITYVKYSQVINGAAHIIICNSTGKELKDIDVTKLAKRYLKKSVRNVNTPLSIVDYEISGSNVDVLIHEYRKSGQENYIASVQTFNINTGKRLKACKLEYNFDRIVAGKLYGCTCKSDREIYGYKAPIEEGYYMYSKNGKKCLWKYECDDVAMRYDIVDESIIYLNKVGVYSLATNDKANPELLVASAECPKLKKTGLFEVVYAVSKDEIYLPYSGSEENTSGDAIGVLKIKKGK